MVHPHRRRCGRAKPSRIDILVQNNLLVGELVLIHGVALGTRIQANGRRRRHLVWSPLSSLLLYGQTADIAAAKEAVHHPSPRLGAFGFKSAS